MKNLDPEYISEVDQISKYDWASVIEKFDDANLYQTWPFGFHSWGENKSSHIILKKEGKIVAAAQARIFEIPIIKAGFAHISWGPMWKSRSANHDFNDFRNFIRALRNYYSFKNKLLVRIRLNEIVTFSIISSLRTTLRRWNRSMMSALPSSMAFSGPM